MHAKRILFLAISLAIYILLWNLAFPYFQYLMDADAVGYLTVADRVANNDWHRSINGLWSPLNSWLLVPFIKKGMDGFTVALKMNALFGGILIVLIEQFLNRFIAHSFFKKTVLLFLPIVAVYYSYFQVFGDLLQLLFVLVYLLIATSENFFGNLFKYILCGVMMALAYYAKAYSLPFFILHFTAIHTWHWWQTKQLYLAKNIMAIGTCILCILPWALQLKSKYGAFSLMGNAGKLNMSWYLLSHKSFNPEIKILVPPTYTNSPSYWEDPYFSQGAFHSPTESMALFARWIARIAHTCLQSIGCMNEISCFVVPLLLIGILVMLRKKNISTFDAFILAIALVPLGYLTMHIETRYIWLMLIGTIVFAGIWVQKLAYTWQQKIATIVFCISIIAYPIYNLEAWRDKGKQNFQIANQLKTLGIAGKKIISNSRDAGNLWVVNYISNNQFYSIEQYDFTTEELSQEIKRYGIEYYIRLKSNGELAGANFTTNQIVYENGDFEVVRLGN
jgi:hypothetical protein